VAIKKDSKQNLLIKIGTIAICVIVVLGLMIPVAGIGVSSCTPQGGGGATGADGSDTSSGNTGTGGSDEGLDLRSMYESSLTKYEGLTTDDPENYSNFEMLGNVAFDWAVSAQQGKLAADPYTVEDLYQKAIAAYTSRLALKASPEVSVDRAIATHYNGDTLGAIEQLEAFTAEDPYFAKAWTNLGVFYATDGQTDKARDSFQKALDNNPDADTKQFIEQNLESLGGN
jgi:tetratricopeptide (TPR) repeat protein